ncbi:(deoxy)nucleoside triphosphate pyrophosphohydrolase [Ferrimonas balearica]|uniref:(deoxy)nucleoside triphosphate pyrophosphohydrolase n=1 Tax=Ferrimonas balearica TaxID=44012 RepID=UPI001C990E99|nr:(deoxy)nucleoside triphosphate pyrophosphohydrolase [Ferrimonas balearica]MBY5993516.1 (deoxy)nucleoside triphosphate pyrophosphohydrolase [Ferrimonas balearica]
MSCAPIDVVAALLMHQGQVMIARRHPNGSQGGWWEFPGGKVEADEAHATALVREIEEELRVRIEVGAYLTSHTHDYGDKRVRLHGYLCHWRPQTIELTGSHDALRWCPPQAVDRSTLAPADLPLLDALLTRCPPSNS